MTAVCVCDLMEAERGMISSSREYALKTLKEAGYVFDEAVLKRMGSSGSCGCWCVATDHLRAVCYGPGEYVEFHMHDRDEVFHVTQGSCRMAVRTEGGGWITRQIERGDTIEIGKDVPHALTAFEKGVCMHTTDLTPRLTMSYSIEQSKIA